MKHTIYGISLVFAAILVIAAVLLVSGKDVRENEMDKALNTAVEQSLEQLKEEGSYDAENYEELIADFNQKLILHVASDSDLKVEILSADTEKGVLDVKITADYDTVKGRRQQSSLRKTVILEEYSDKRMYHQVDFSMEGEIYAGYSLYEGSLIVLPKEPQKEGYTFKGWKDTGSGALLEAGKRAEGDLSFEAVFE